MAHDPGILIVDDNEDNRYTLQLLLESDGHERIASASSGTEAIALIERQSFNLVLLDLMMPIVDGWEVLDRMRADPSLDDVRVCVCSAAPDQLAAMRADFVLHKPVDLDALRHVVDSVA